MSSLYIPVGMTIKGLSPSPVDVVVRHVSTAEAGGGLTGNVVQFDMNAASADTTDLNPGVDTSGFVNVIQPDQVTQSGTYFAVLLEDIPAGTSGLARVFGLARTSVNADVTVGASVVPTVGDVGDTVGAAGNIIIGKGAEATSGNPGIGLVFIDGFGGLGVV